ncbi:ferrous iron transport protein B [candidate division KSB1 bacterium]|nr:MAG: ferrous iron transport protein B [candidate division KSB1 bacterium]
MGKKKTVRVAISSIPNTGKSTLFNILTGAHQSVGNWPGVSVEKKTGKFELNGYIIDLIDLPGCYSLTATSIEEKVVRDFILQTPPDVIINIVDARNLYRSLGLTLQLAQSGIPMIVAVNMMDEARRMGLKIDFNALSEHLGMPVVPIVARKGEGIGQLKKVLLDVIEGKVELHTPKTSCPIQTDPSVVSLANEIKQLKLNPKLNDVFLAVRLLESDDVLKKFRKKTPETKELCKSLKITRKHLEHTYQDHIPTACAHCRFNSARGLVMETTSEHITLTDHITEKIDSVLLHKYLGIPLFVLIMLLLFQGIYALGTPLQDWIGQGFEWLQNATRALPFLQHASPFLTSFIVDGLLQGIGVVVAFFPIIAFFFIFMSIVEDSGYMARAAFLLDHLMHAIGLDGRAFINILLGYGCNVPAIMGTRILSSQHNRIITMLVIPFTLCSARLQVFIFISGILFTASVAPWVVFSLYFLSFVVVILVGLFLKLIHYAGKPEPFIMEIPPYRLPTLRTVLLRAWEEMKDFLNRASTIIVIGVIFVWLLTNLPPGVQQGSMQSWAAKIGQVASPVFHPLGIGWQEIIALLFGFIAKEIVIGSLAVIYGGNPAAHIAAHISPLQGISFMIFTLLYAPCVATIAAIKAESGSWKVTGFSVGLGLILAWLLSFFVYQGGRLLGF